MNRLSALAAAAAVALATVTASVAPAAAGHRDAVAAGAIGLLGGLIIGGAIANAQPAPPVYVAPRGYVPVRGGNPHVAWCSGKYRSYSPYDNTWIDRHGRVRACVSPYGY